MNNKTIAIVGAGNMGSCLLSGLLANGYPEHLLWISNPSKDKLIALQKATNAQFNITTDNIEAVKNADIVLFAVKPVIFPSVLKELSDVLKQKNPLIISTAAGVLEKIIRHKLNPDISIIRAMPNTPAMLRCGATALYANNNVTDQQRNLAENIFRAVGITVWVDEEKQMDMVTAVSGSGPAYFFLVMEAIQQAGIDLGLPASISQLLTLQTAYGAARMALENSHTVAELRNHVTSKGGTTEQAIKTLENANIRGIFKDALQDACQRAEEISQMLKNEMEN